jgi:hypothetical protein
MTELDPGYERVAVVLADAWAEAMVERPLAGAAVTSIVDRLASMYAEHDPGFDPVAFRAAANYRGYSDGTNRPGLLPSR